MTTLFLYSFLFLTISVGHCADKFLYFFGGGGEPKGDTTIFDSDIPQIAKFLGSKGNAWKGAHSFNGGHAKTESLLSKNLGQSENLGGFNKASFEKYITELETKIENGDIKSGDQLLIVLNTHGAMAKKDEKSHSVALSGTAEDLKTLSGSQTISMDRMEKLITLAAEKGVKLGFADLSCFSGNTIKLANKNVCLISATGSNHYGFAEVRDETDKGAYYVFAGRFLDNLKKGVSLEEAFLKARRGSISSDFPMISTDEGMAINELIYDLITPYLNYNSGPNHDFSKIYDKKNLDGSFCKSRVNFEELYRALNEIEKIQSISKKLINTKKLKDSLNIYRSYQVQYEVALSNSQKAAEEVKDLIASLYPDEKKLFEKEDGLSIISVSREASIKLYKDLMEGTKSEYTKGFYKKLYDELLLKDQIAKDVKEKLSAESKAKVKKFDDLFRSSGVTEKLASKVGESAKELYDQLYRSMIKNKKESNPCRDFIL